MPRQVQRGRCFVNPAVSTHDRPLARFSRSADAAHGACVPRGKSPVRSDCLVALVLATSRSVAPADAAPAFRVTRNSWAVRAVLLRPFPSGRVVWRRAHARNAGGKQQRGRGWRR